jgi:hypothetical protein
MTYRRIGQAFEIFAANLAGQNSAPNVAGFFNQRTQQLLLVVSV